MRALAAAEVHRKRHQAALCLLSCHVVTVLSPRQLAAWFVAALPVTPLPYPTFLLGEQARGGRAGGRAGGRRWHVGSSASQQRQLLPTLAPHALPHPLSPCSFPLPCPLTPYLVP
jgi:hypothetical protein